MIFYTKKPPFAGGVTKFYHGAVKKSFNFFYFAHSDHHATFKELLKDEGKRYALFDLAACYAAQLQYRGMLNLRPFLDQAMEYFKLGLQARGYTLGTADEIGTLSHEYENTVILVTGCQTPEVRNARVDGAYETIKCLQVPIVSIVLSGAHPSVNADARGVRSEEYPIEPDEAGAMRVRFDQRMRADRHPPAARMMFFKESKATRTKENIENFFKTTSFDSSKSSHLLVSSSAFHLPRVADELEAYLLQNPQGIDRITLISAEHFDLDRGEDPFRNQIYIKQMMFELFRMMFMNESDNLDRLFEREISLKV